MRYSIWRKSPDGDAFPITSSGNTGIKEAALEKAENLNERLQLSDPGTGDLFIVKDENGREIKPTVLVPKSTDSVRPVIEKIDKKPVAKTKTKRAAKKKSAPKRKAASARPKKKS